MHERRRNGRKCRLPGVQTGARIPVGRGDIIYAPVRTKIHVQTTPSGVAAKLLYTALCPADKRKEGLTMTKNSRLALWLMIPAFLLCFAARFIQIAGGTDMTSGMLYYDNGFLLNFSFYGLVILTFVLTLVFCAVDRKRGGAAHTKPVSAISGGGAAAIGVMLIPVGCAAAYEGYVETQSIASSPLLIFAGFFFGAALVVLAFVTVYMKEFKPALGFAYTAGGFYFTLRGIVSFLKRMVIASIPEYLIECVAVIAMAAFFMLLARLLSGNEGKLTRMLLIPLGSAACVMTLSSALATIAAGFFAPQEVAGRITYSPLIKELEYQRMKGVNAYMMAYTPWVDAAVALFILAVLIALHMRGASSASYEDHDVS